MNFLITLNTTILNNVYLIIIISYQLFIGDYDIYCHCINICYINSEHFHTGNIIF